MTQGQPRGPQLVVRPLRFHSPHASGVGTARFLVPQPILLRTEVLRRLRKPTPTPPTHQSCPSLGVPPAQLAGVWQTLHETNKQQVCSAASRSSTPPAPHGQSSSEQARPRRSPESSPQFGAVSGPGQLLVIRGCRCHGPGTNHITRRTTLRKSITSASGNDSHRAVTSGSARTCVEQAVRHGQGRLVTASGLPVTATPRGSQVGPSTCVTAGTPVADIANLTLRGGSIRYLADRRGIAESSTCGT